MSGMHRLLPEVVMFGSCRRFLRNPSSIGKPSYACDTGPLSAGGTAMRLIAATCVMGMLAACARSDDPSEPTAAASTAPQAAVERAGHGRLRSDIDTSALQRLLAAVPYSSRELVRTSFELVPGEMRDLSFRDRAQDELAAAVYKQSDGRTQGQSQRSADAERRLNLWSRPVLLALATDTKLVPKDGVLVLRSGKWDYDAVLLGQDAATPRVWTLRYALSTRSGSMMDCDRDLTASESFNCAQASSHRDDKTATSFRARGARIWRPSWV